MAGFPTGGSGGLTLLGSQTLGAAGGSVSVSAIPGTYNFLMAIASGATVTSAAESWKITVNGSSTAVYSYDVNGSNTTNQAGWVIGNALSKNGVSTLQMWLPLYAAGAWKSAVFLAGFYDPITPAGNTVYANGVWANTAPITQLTVVSSTGDNFVSGTALFVYGA